MIDQTLDQTPIDTTPNTPLDALKGAYLRGRDRIDTALSELTGTYEFADDNSTIGMLDEAEHALALLVCEALGYDKPDRNWVPTRETAPDLYRYDDGTQVVYAVPLGPHVQMDIWPRFDTKESVQALLGYSLDLVFPTTEMRAAKWAAEAEADARRSHSEGGAE